MRQIEQHTIQFCRACGTYFEIVKEDCIIGRDRFWLSFRCLKCNRLNELHGIPQSFRSLLDVV